MKIKNIVFFVSLVGLFFLTGCGAGGVEDKYTEDTRTKYDTAKLLNLYDVNDFDAITGSKSATALRSISTSSSNVDLSTSAWSKVAELAKKVLDAKYKTTKKRSITDNGSTVIYEDRVYGSISGYADVRLEVNKDTSLFRGYMDYYNYKDSKDDICSKPLEINGSLNIVGKYDLYNDVIKEMTMTAYDDTNINSIIFKSGFSIELLEVDSTTFLYVLNGDIIQNYKNYGFKDYKIKSYPGEYYEYSYSYPISGNIYIFSDELNGYFYVDPTYRHDLTPTKSDICQENFYTGKERYIGKNSTMTFTIDAKNHYKIEIDEGNDGSIDRIIEAEL